MSEMSRDTAGVIVPPPLIRASVLLVGLALNSLVPMRLLGHIPLTVKVLLGTINFVVVVAMVIDANYVYRRIGTPLPPSQPILAFATTGRLGSDIADGNENSEQLDKPRCTHFSAADESSSCLSRTPSERFYLRRQSR